jgi:diguanylate cyclase
MSPDGASVKTPADTTDGLGPVAAGYGPVGIVRELARDLLRQRRLRADEAGAVELALRTRDWPRVRLCLEVAMARRPEPAPARAAAVAHPGPASPPAAPVSPPVLPAVTPADGPASARAADAGAHRGVPDDTHEAGIAQEAERKPEADGAQEADIAPGLLRLVLHLFDALARLAGNDEHFAQRFRPIREMLAARLTPERLVEADACITTLIEQQLGVQQNLKDARDSLKDMLGLLVDRIGSVGDSTARFGQRIGAYQQELDGTPDAAALRRVSGALLADTRQVAEQIRSTQQDLAAARAKVDSYEKRVRSLEQELAQTVRMVQNDPLTRSLNRRGLDEVFRVETARAARYRMPLVLAMIDLDDFKAINDRLGHAAGDRALVHFVTTAQACLRPTDAMARSGGEEFVIVLPATGMEHAVDAVRRILRELARSPFAHEDQQIGLTFSGGVAQWQPGETLDQVLRRADAAMYDVKRKGKNRVEPAVA